MGLNKAGICKIEGCQKEVKRSGGSKGMCAMHYRRVQKHGSPDVILTNSRYYGDGAICSEEECASRPYGRGLCKMHYYRAHRAKNEEYYIVRSREQWNKKMASREKELDRPRPTECEICGGTDKTICYDHDHHTGLGRGWICGGCNAGLGHFLDNPARLIAAAEYIIRSRAGDEADKREQELDAQIIGLQNVIRAERQPNETSLNGNH